MSLNTYPVMQLEKIHVRSPELSKSLSIALLGRQDLAERLMRKGETLLSSLPALQNVLRQDDKFIC